MCGDAILRVVLTMHDNLLPILAAFSNRIPGFNPTIVTNLNDSANYKCVDILFILILHYNILYYYIHFTMLNLHLLEFYQKLFGAMCTIFNAWQSR